MRGTRGAHGDLGQEAIFGVVPVLFKERALGFREAFLVLSGYCIATWSYTQGVYLATLVGFRQLLIGAFFGALLMLLIYQLPVILSVRFGIDIWVWLRTVFGGRGVRLMTVLIIVINFPWYAVCADLFASSMTNLAGLLGLETGRQLRIPLCLLCIALGVLIALRGVGAITKATRILVPMLLAAGIVVIIVGCTSVPVGSVWNYRPVHPEGGDRLIYYIMSIEANFAFVITLVGGMAGVPRLARTERAGYWAGVLGQGVSGSLFVVAGAVMSIAMQHATGEATDDPTRMLATLAIPALGLCSLLLVAFANIGTQAVGLYLYGITLKTSFRKADYRALVLILASYVAALCFWGRIVEHFGAFLTVTACVYAPLAALLFADFFIVRRQRVSLRDAFGLPGRSAYHYTNGFNLVGIFCILFGVSVSLAIYDPVHAVVRMQALFPLTPTGASFVATALLYCVLSHVPVIRRYLFQDDLRDSLRDGLKDGLQHTCRDSFQHTSKGVPQGGREGI